MRLVDAVRLHRQLRLQRLGNDLPYRLFIIHARSAPISSTHLADHTDRSSRIDWRTSSIRAKYCLPVRLTCVFTPGDGWIVVTFLM